MKVPLNWLRDYVPLNLSVPELIDRLTIAGLEVGSVRLFGLPKPEGLRTKLDEPGPVWEADKVVTAQILGVDKHPNADKLKLVQLDYGAGTPKQVVTGAPNISVGDKGQKVVLGLTGCRFFDGHTTPKGIKELKPAELRGVPSDSMVMSNFELGISDEHEGIILLEDEAPVGKPLAEYMGDAVLEIDILPNMARCLGMVNVAREVAALTGATSCVPEPNPKTHLKSIEGRVKIQIDDPKLCGRYAAILIENVRIKPAPGWMKRRLIYSGVRSISNIVDITNYVMLEFGQPLHAFDYDVLVQRAGGKPPTIIVRPAKAGEVLKTLDGVDRTLAPENLVIADEKGAIALAGVMGGAETEVSDKTTTILLESANFDYVSIRRTARQFDLFSEASTRFSRGIHTEVAKTAALRAAELMQQHADGTVLSGIADSYPAPTPGQTISLKRSEIRRLLGLEIPPKEVERILTALNFTLAPQGEEGWQVTAPPYRTDIQAGAADLIEELARIQGYDRIPATMLSGELPPQKNQTTLAREERVRDLLATLGLQEIITYSLTGKELEAKLGITGEYVELKNPVAPERAVMRKSLLPGLLTVAEQNLRHAPSARLFELGPVYLPDAKNLLPTEPRRLSIVLAGHRAVAAWDDVQGQKPREVDFYDLKGIVESLFAQLHLDGVKYLHVPDVSFLHPARSAEVKLGDESLGVFGELHPKTAIGLGVKDKKVLVADLNLEAILAKIPERFAFQPVSSFPPALRDIAVIVDENVTNEKVVAEILTAGGTLLKRATLFDLYRGDSIPSGKKSLAYALCYQSNEGTLADKEIDKAHKKVEDRLKHVLKASIRGQ
jgi:phenylalanyl-tRNA synthetase beta chain